MANVCALLFQVTCFVGYVIQGGFRNLFETSDRFIVGVWKVMLGLDYANTFVGSFLIERIERGPWEMEIHA